MSNKSSNTSNPNDNKSKLTNLFKWFLDLVRDQEALTGDKALRTLAYILILRLSEPQINNGTIDIKTTTHYENGEDDIEVIKKMLKYIKFSELAKLKEDNITGIIKNLLIILPHHPNFKKFFKDGEDPFRIKKDSTFFKIIKRFNEFEFEKYDVDIQGEAYEEVIKDIMVGKVLGQFFTPPFLKQLVVELVNPQLLDDGKMETIYDPAMGTGGFLITCLRHMIKQGNDKKVKLNWDFIIKEGLGGREIEQDTHKLCEANMLISSGQNFETLECGDSLRVPKNKKYDIVVANPPFGISLKYNEINSTINKQDYIPIQVNSAVPLFLQLIIYLLKINGRAGVIVPNGQDLFNKSTGLVALREYIVKTCDLKEIIHIPSGVFNSTDIKTCIFYFVKKKEGGDVLKVGNKKKNMYKFVDGFSTNVVKFYDYDCEKKVKKLIVEVGINDIAKNYYSLNYMDYVKKEEIVYGEGIQVMRLGDVCKINYGTRITKKDNTIGEYPVYGSGDVTFTTNKYNREGWNILIGRFAASQECTRIVNCKLFLNDSGLTIFPLDENLLNYKYVGYYLHQNNNLIYDCCRGTAQKNLDVDVFKNIQIPIPPLPIQQEIIQKLEQNDNIIQSLQKEIEHLKILSKRIITNITTPKVQEKKPILLKDITESIQMGKHNLNSDEYSKSETTKFKIPYYTSGGLKFCEKHTYDGNYLLINRNPKSANNFIKVNGKFNTSKKIISIKLKEEYINKIDDIMEQLNKIDFVDIVKNNPVVKSSKESVYIELEYFNDISVAL